MVKDASAATLGTPGIIDAHLHQWNPRRTPWAANRLSRTYRMLPRLSERLFPVVVPRATREYVLTPRTVGRAYETSDYVRDATALAADTAGLPDLLTQVEAVVLASSRWGEVRPVEEPNPLDELSYLLNLPYGVGSSPRLGAIVVSGDPQSERLAADLDAQLSVTDKITAVRYLGTRHPDPQVRNGGDIDAALASAAFLTGIERVAERGLGLEVGVYSHQLHEVAAVAAAFPELSVVVEHLGIPVGIFGPVGSRTGATAAARADIARLWRERLSTLATHPNVAVKLSGLAMPILGYGQQRSGNIGGRETLTEMMAPQVRHVVSAFGPDRVMFGSNFPIDRPNAPLDMLIGALAEMLEPFGADLTQNVFRGNAMRIYRIAAK